MNIFVREKEKLDYFASPKGGITNVYLKERSQLRFYTFNLGKQSVKNELNIIFQGKNSKAELYGLYLPRSQKVIENNTFLHHQMPFCQSFQQYYGIVFGKGRAVFNGRILVENKAQKTDAYLESKNILLDEGGQILGRPFLEIFADDVKCTHAFSASQIEEDEIFYLQSRGIHRDKAKDILLLAFAQKIISKVDKQEIKENLCARISQSLGEK